MFAIRPSLGDLDRGTWNRQMIVMWKLTKKGAWWIYCLLVYCGYDKWKFKGVIVADAAFICNETLIMLAKLGWAAVGPCKTTSEGPQSKQCTGCQLQKNTLMTLLLQYLHITLNKVPNQHQSFQHVNHN
jgi:hypothetical protein